MQGTMRQKIVLLGTSLRLLEGQIVHLTPASNQPNGGYFARPLDCVWPDGIERGIDDSIYISAENVPNDLKDITHAERRTSYRPRWFEDAAGVINEKYVKG